MSDLSGVQLTFGSDGTTVKVNGSGTDDKGNYTIVNSSYDSSSKKISFTKQYKVNANMARNYQGIYHNNEELFSGTWGDAKNPNTGNFLIKRVSPVEGSDKEPDESKIWHGYCFDANNNASLMLMNITVWKDLNGDKILTGSGTDAIGAFTIDGRISGENVSLFKRHFNQSWNYNGKALGLSMIFGTWGTKVPYDGAFIFWSV